MQPYDVKLSLSGLRRNSRYAFIHQNLFTRNRSTIYYYAYVQNVHQLIKFFFALFFHLQLQFK